MDIEKTTVVVIRKEVIRQASSRASQDTTDNVKFSFISYFQFKPSPETLVSDLGRQAAIETSKKAITLDPHTLEIFEV